MFPDFRQPGPLPWLLPTSRRFFFALSVLARLGCMTSEFLLILRGPRDPLVELSGNLFNVKLDPG